MLWVAIFRALVNENRHDGEPVIGLEQYLFREQKPRGAVDETRWIVNGCAEIAGWAGTILDSEQVIAAVPLESLVPEPECVAVAGWNQGARRCRATSAIGVVAVLRRNVGPRAG